MKPLAISGMGLVGAFGCGRGDLLAAIAAGKTVVTQTELRGQTIPVYRADVAPLEKYLNKRALRRIDHFSRLALLGAYETLADAGQPELDKSRIGVIVGSGFGALATTFAFLDSVIKDGDVLASPTAFSNSVHNAAVAHLTMQLGISGPGLTVSQFDMSYVSALLAASQWLEEGRVDAVLYGVVDEYCDVLGYCLQRYASGVVPEQMRPLDADELTAIAGEGAAFLLLQRAEDVADRVQIQAVQMGQSSDFEQRGELLFNCDGFPQTVRHYASAGQGHCYTQLYGASPVAPAFDLAVATLALEGAEPLKALAAKPQIDCLRYGFGGEFGHVQLGR